LRWMWSCSFEKIGQQPLLTWRLPPSSDIIRTVIPRKSFYATKVPQ
jgi:hypothetical protein